MRVYLDCCCLNRPYDDQLQLRIKLETEARLKILEEIRSGRIELAWSYVLDYENIGNPFEERKKRIQEWKKYAKSNIHENSDVIGFSNALVTKGLRSIDAMHIACAIAMNCTYFLTTDDGVLSKSWYIEEIKVNDPIEFIKKELS